MIVLDCIKIQINLIDYLDGDGNTELFTDYSLGNYEYASVP